MEEQKNDESLIAIVKNWVTIDNQIRLINKKLKDLRSQKKIQNENMIRIMKSNEIDNLELKDGEIRHVKTKKRQVLTQKLLIEILNTHPQFDNDNVKQLTDFVYNNRKVIEEDKIVRVVNEN